MDGTLAFSYRGAHPFPGKELLTGNPAVGRRDYAWGLVFGRSNCVPRKMMRVFFSGPGMALLGRPWRKKEKQL
jgi:hypothetical protein